jgi:hypothetical protein
MNGTDLKRECRLLGFRCIVAGSFTIADCIAHVARHAGRGPRLKKEKPARSGLSSFSDRC